MSSSVIRHPSPVFLWLLICALLVAAMVLIGGYTRLSGSGLSITAWKPIHGALPPLNAAQWQEEFDAYRASPQYLKVNSGMTLSEFQVIFWPEFIHRLLGRLIGAVFFLPLIFFALRRSISKRFFWRLCGIFALGGVQGLIGWLMVKSGLVDDPHVSHLRLAAHLSVAFAIYALLLWAAMDVKTKGQRLQARETTPSAFCLSSFASLATWFTLLCLQLILGAFMAGLHAGLIYNTWPSMNGQFLPDGLVTSLPWYDNLTMVQFLHRNLAIFLAFSFLFWWYFAREYVRSCGLGLLCAGVAAVIALQIMLGVLTLLYVVPLPLALAHQMTGLVLFTLAVMMMHRIRIV